MDPKTPDIFDKNYSYIDVFSELKFHSEKNNAFKLSQNSSNVRDQYGLALVTAD